MKYYALLPVEIKVVCDKCSGKAEYIVAEVRWENEEYLCRGCFTIGFITLDHTVLKYSRY